MVCVLCVRVRVRVRVCVAEREECSEELGEVSGHVAIPPRPPPPAKAAIHRNVTPQRPVHSSAGTYHTTMDIASQLI